MTEKQSDQAEKPARWLTEKVVVPVVVALIAATVTVFTVLYQKDQKQASAGTSQSPVTTTEVPEAKPKGKQPAAPSTTLISPSSQIHPQTTTIAAPNKSIAAPLKSKPDKTTAGTSPPIEKPKPADQEYTALLAVNYDGSDYDSGSDVVVAAGKYLKLRVEVRYPRGQLYVSRIPKNGASNGGPMTFPISAKDEKYLTFMESQTLLVYEEIEGDSQHRTLGVFNIIVANPK